MTRLRSLLAPAAALLLAACGSDRGEPFTPPPVGETPQGRDLSWLRENVVPIATERPGGPYDDLMPLKATIGDARIVSLGEATHGTAEFFRMKHRMLEFLVKEMGFNTFVMEAGVAESAAIDGWIRTGNGVPEQLLADLGYWPWNSHEVLDMLRWMRAQRQAPGARVVTFHGMDVQGARAAMAEVVATVALRDHALGTRVNGEYGCLQAYQESVGGGMTRNYADASLEYQDGCRARLVGVKALLESRRDLFTGPTAESDWREAVHLADVVAQVEDVWRGLDPRARDRYMAANVAWLADHLGPEARIVVWAHNGHVANYPGQMGEHLRARFGGDMVVFGFTFYAGYINALPFVGNQPVVSVVPPTEGSYESEFHRLGHSLFALDLRKVASAPASARWLDGPLRVRHIGARYVGNAVPGAYTFDLRLPSLYDVIIHVEESTPTALLPRR